MPPRRAPRDRASWVAYTKRALDLIELLRREKYPSLDVIAADLNVNLRTA